MSFSVTFVYGSGLYLVIFYTKCKACQVRFSVVWNLTLMDIEND